MEDLIGILTVILMIPGLIMLVGVVLLTMFHLKGDGKPPTKLEEPVRNDA